VNGDKGLDYKRCLTNKEFGKEAIMADLLYFKYYFLDALRKPYDKQKLIDDFEALSNYLTHTEYKYFMFRDFQSRNIFVKKDESVHFIDYQGGMKGAPQYDVASMLWQARANLSDEWKEKLLLDYINALEKVIHSPIDHTVFKSQYNGYVLIRLLQVLGAYGFRGLFERKAHFLTSIPLALTNLKWFNNNQSTGIALPEFKKVLDICVSDEIISQFTPLQADEKTALVIKINSFSYKNGIPDDESGNGGGFVFDCRGILNPGRIEEFKTQTGRDKSVKDYLEQQTKMQEFLNSAFDIVDITVEDYLKRNFENLVISFGCTGGQHRSVYAADALARHLRNKFKVVKAAGGLVRKKEKFLMIYRMKKWDLPKGKADKKESPEKCAVRETEEETGVNNIKLLSPLITTYHTYHEGSRFILKETKWFRMKVSGEQKLSPQAEENITKLLWVKETEVKKYLENSFPSVEDVVTEGFNTVH
jgi:8-oxo-dGTP pyrophosphatase MutT (NUDIX family)